MDNLVELANKICDGLKIAAHYSSDRPYIQELLNEASAFIEGILPMLIAEEANKDKEVKSAELQLTFKEQLQLKGSERLEKIKEERETKHKLWLKNNTEIIEYFKSKLLKTAENTGAKVETVPLDNITLTRNDVNEIYYYFEKEGIRVSGQGFTPVKYGVVHGESTTYTSLRFDWED